MIITHDIIESLTKNRERYFLPDTIREAVENCLQSDDRDAIIEKSKWLEREYINFRDEMAPATIDYTDPLILDAYTVTYLSRNFCIPFIGLRALVYHPLYQNFPSSIKVLDIGSGVGAVVLGLLWLFNQTQLSDISVNIIAVDSTIEALNRQRDLILKAGFQINQVKLLHKNIRDTDHFIESLKDESPFNLIFSANCFTETPEPDVIRLVNRLPEILLDDGAIIIAEPARDYTLTLIKTIAASAKSMNLNVYYPCPPHGCPSIYTHCWAWRNHTYEIPDIKVKGQPLQGDFKDQLVASWLILTKQEISIYDSFKQKRPDLLYGPIARQMKAYRAICCGDKEVQFRDASMPPAFLRGNIVGLSSELEVKDYREI